MGERKIVKRNVVFSSSKVILRAKMKVYHQEMIGRVFGVKVLGVSPLEK